MTRCASTPREVRLSRDAPSGSDPAVPDKTQRPLRAVFPVDGPR